MDDAFYESYDEDLDDPLPPITPPKWIDGIDPTRISGRATSSQDAFTLFMNDLQRRMRGEIIGLPWPPEWSALGRRVGPIEPGSLTVVASRPSVGKTMFGMQLLRYLASQGKRVLYVSRELSTVRLIRRHVCAYGANMGTLRTGSESDTDSKALDTYLKESRDWQVHYDDISQSVEDVCAESILTEPDIIIVDYLQRFAYDTEKEYAAITRIVNELQDFTLAANIPVICLSQLSRPMKGTEAKAPSMSDTRGSGAVEERAANLILLHRVWETAVEERNGKQVEVAKTQTEDGFFIVAKCADGETGRPIPVTFSGARMRIVEKL